MTEIAKAGWLMRESTFLKRWKKAWFSLSVDGLLRYFESPDDLVAKRTISVSKDVIEIKTGVEIANQHRAPEGLSSEYLIKLVTRDDGSWILCADSVDDMLAWQLALEQARVAHQPAYQQRLRREQNQQVPSYLVETLTNNPNNGYPVYYRGANYRGAYPSRIVHTPQGPITVVYLPDYRYNYYSGSDIALGALAGTAIASTLFWPFWFPLFWC